MSSGYCGTNAARFVKRDTAFVMVQSEVSLSLRPRLTMRVGWGNICRPVYAPACWGRSLGARFRPAVIAAVALRRRSAEGLMRIFCLASRRLVGCNDAPRAGEWL